MAHIYVYKEGEREREREKWGEGIMGSTTL